MQALPGQEEEEEVAELLPDSGQMCPPADSDQQQGKRENKVGPSRIFFFSFVMVDVPRVWLWSRTNWALSQ